MAVELGPWIQTERPEIQGTQSPQEPEPGEPVQQYDNQRESLTGDPYNLKERPATE